jgi:hypothetical protein
MFYVSPYWRLVRRFFLLLCSCALVASIARGDVVVANGQCYICVRDDSPCMNTNVSINWQEWGTQSKSENWGWQSGVFIGWEDLGGKPHGGTFTANTQAGYPGEGPNLVVGGSYYWVVGTIPVAVWNASDFQADGTFSYTVTPSNGDSPPYQTVNQATYGGAQNPSTWPPSVAYASIFPNPCNPGSTLDNNTSLVNVTNNTGGYEYVPETGQILAPGQSANNVPISVPENSTTGTNVLESLNNANGLWQDGQMINLTNNYSWSSANGWTNWNTMGVTAPPNNGAYSDSLYTNSGGPIIWQSSTLSNPASVDAAGFSDIANNQLLQDQLLSNLLSRPLTVQLSGSNGVGGSSSNVWVQNWPSNFNAGGTSSTNGGVGASNVWVQNWPITNGTSATNAIAQMLAGTNAAYQVLNSMGAAENTFTSQLPTSLSDDAGSAQEQDITVGNPNTGQIKFQVGSIPDSMMNFYTSLRSLVAWVIVLILCWANFDDMFKCVHGVLEIQGAQGPDTGTIAAALGGNVVSALTVASIIVALVSSIPTVAVGFLTGEMSFWLSFTSPTAFFHSSGNSWAYSWASQIIPIGVLVSAVGTRMVFWVAVRVLDAVLSAIAKTLIGV